MALVCTPIVAAVTIPNAGGFVGRFLLRKNIGPFYESLEKPSWIPHGCVFASTWFALYSGMGYASYLVYKDGEGFAGAAKIPLIVYGTNVALNWALTPLLFGCHNLKATLANYVLVDATAVATACLFNKVNKTAGYLFIPYLLWLGFETALMGILLKSNPKIQEITEEKKK